MNVRQLRSLLLDYPDDLEILISSDAEGNEFNRLIELGTSYIYANDDKHGSLDSLISDEDAEAEDLWKYVEPRLVLWP